MLRSKSKQSSKNTFKLQEKKRNFISHINLLSIRNVHFLDFFMMLQRSLHELKIDYSIIINIKKNKFAIMIKESVFLKECKIKHVVMLYSCRGHEVWLYVKPFRLKTKLKMHREFRLRV